MLEIVHGDAIEDAAVVVAVAVEHMQDEFSCTVRRVLLLCVVDGR